MENPIKMDDLEVPQFSETSICQRWISSAVSKWRWGNDDAATTIVRCLDAKTSCEQLYKAAEKEQRLATTGPLAALKAGAI